MATTEEVVKRLRDSRPPATDAVTYLTIVEMSISPDILPDLREILEDVKLTNEIGWDLVEMLIHVPGSEKCLETIARLGNPREVIVKVLEVMEKTALAEEDGDGGDDDADEDDENDDDGDDDEEDVARQSARILASSHFITLCGMLAILHKRLQVKSASRFLHTSLETVYKAYDPTSAEATAAVVSLVQSLSGQKRPPLPTRKSSTTLDTPFQGISDASKSAPDPEAEKSELPDVSEPQVMARLLQSFITCVIEAYVNTNNMEWASRLLEYTYPQRIPRGKKTMLQAFKEVDELLARDALIGQLVAAAEDLGLANVPSAKTKEILEGPVVRDPLSIDFDPSDPDNIKVSTGGFLCLTAYWIFASDIFDTDHGLPDMFMLPDHQTALKRFLGDEPQAQIVGNPGSVEALMVIAIWLDGQQRISKGPSDSGNADATFMAYHHLLTLVSVFHPNLRVRNAATVIAGLVLHADPDEDDRLSILEDLLENCMFSSLQACAVTWLREEIIAARKAGSTGRFANPDFFDTLQYTLFPSLTYLKEADTETILEFWTQSAPAHLQTANFALFLYGENYRELAPPGMAASIEHRYVEPLQHVGKTLTEAIEKKEIGADGQDGGALLDLRILMDTLSRVQL